MRNISHGAETSPAQSLRLSTSLDLFLKSALVPGAVLAWPEHFRNTASWPLSVALYDEGRHRLACRQPVTPLVQMQSL